MEVDENYEEELAAEEARVLEEARLRDLGAAEDMEEVVSERFVDPAASAR